MSIDTKIEAPNMVIPGEVVAPAAYEDVRPNARAIELSMGNRIPDASEEVNAYTDLINYCDEKAQEVAEVKAATVKEYEGKIAAVREGKALTKDIFENHRNKLAALLSEKADELLVHFDTETYVAIKIRLGLKEAEGNLGKVQNAITLINQDIANKTEELLSEQTTYSYFQDKHGRVLACLDDTNETGTTVETANESGDAASATVRSREDYLEEEAALDEAISEQLRTVTSLKAELERLYDIRDAKIKSEANITMFIAESKNRLYAFQNELVPKYNATIAKLANVAKYVIEDIKRFRTEGETDIAELDRQYEKVEKIEQISSPYSYAYLPVAQATERKLRLLDYTKERGPAYTRIPNIKTDDPEFYELAATSVETIKSLRLSAGHIHAKKAEYKSLQSEETEEAEAEERQIQQAQQHYQSVARSIERGLERARTKCQDLATTQYAFDTDTAAYEADVTSLREQIAQCEASYSEQYAASEKARQEAATAKANVELLDSEIRQLEERARMLGQRGDKTRELEVQALNDEAIERVLMEFDGSGYYHTEERVWTPDDFISLKDVYHDKVNDKPNRAAQLVKKKAAHDTIEQIKTSLRANRRELDRQLMHRQAEYEITKQTATEKIQALRIEADIKLGAAEQWLENNGRTQKPKQSVAEDNTHEEAPQPAPTTAEWDSVKPTATRLESDTETTERTKFDKVSGIGMTVLSNVRQAIRR